MKTDYLLNIDEKELRGKIRAILIECRHEKGVSQAEVGRQVGKTENAIGAWEQGISVPDIVTLARLAKYYHKSLDYMYGEADK